MDVYFMVFMFFAGLFSISLSLKHLLLLLLGLEFVVLSLYFLFFYYLSMNMSEVFFSMVFIAFSVCEGALGLSLLVSLIRLHGSDYIQGLVVLW